MFLQQHAFLPGIAQASVALALGNVIDFRVLFRGGGPCLAEAGWASRALARGPKTPTPPPHTDLRQAAHSLLGTQRSDHSGVVTKGLGVTDGQSGSLGAPMSLFGSASHRRNPRVVGHVRGALFTMAPQAGNKRAESLDSSIGSLAFQQPQVFPVSDPVTCWGGGGGGGSYGRPHIVGARVLELSGERRLLSQARWGAVSMMLAQPGDVSVPFRAWARQGQPGRPPHLGLPGPQGSLTLPPR